MEFKGTLKALAELFSFCIPSVTYVELVRETLKLFLPSFFLRVSSAVLGLMMLQPFVMQRGCANGSSRAAGLIVVVTRHLWVYE